MHSRILALFVLACISVHAFSFPKVYRIRPEDSRIGFTIMKWLVIKEEGRFRDYSGMISFDETNPSATRVEVTINAASVDSRDKDRDGVIRSREFFHVDQYPSLTFVSTGVRQRNKDTLDVTGDFTLRGVTKRITVPVRILGVTNVPGMGSIAGFEARFIINRLDFGVAPNQENLLGREVTIELMIGAISTTDKK